MENRSSSYRADSEKKSFAVRYSVKCANADGLFPGQHSAGRKRKKQSAAPASANGTVTLAINLLEICAGKKQLFCLRVLAVFK